MDKRKRRLIIIIEIIVLLFIGFVDWCVCKYNNRPIAVYDYGNYEIVIRSNSYCKESHCGRLNMEIRQQNGETKKLFDTSDDRLHDGSDVIIDKEDWLQMQGATYTYVSEAYETAYKEGVQHVVIYYINKGFSGEMAEMKLVFVDRKSEEEKFSKVIEPKIDEKMLMFVNEKQRIYVTAEGIRIEPGPGSDLYNSIAMITGIMDVKWKNKSREVSIRKYAETAGYASPGIIKPKARWTSKKGTSNTSAGHCYAVELDDWNKIEEVRIGNYVFKKIAER